MGQITLSGLLFHIAELEAERHQARADVCAERAKRLQAERAINEFLAERHRERFDHASEMRRVRKRAELAEMSMRRIRGDDR